MPFAFLLQAFTVTVCAHRVAGGPTAPLLATVRTVDPAPLRMEPVNVHQAIEGQCAKEVSPAEPLPLCFPFMPPFTASQLCHRLGFVISTPASVLNIPLDNCGETCPG